MSYVIKQIVDLGGAVKAFHIRRVDGGPLPEWQAGAHITVMFDAVDGSRYERRYSLIGVLGQGDVYQIAVQREAEGKGGSRCLHDEYAVGDAIDIAGPFNGFPLLATKATSRVTLLGAGIGVTPILSMAHALRAQDIPFDVHYLVRSEERAVLLEALSDAVDETVVPHLSQHAGRADVTAMLGAYEAGRELYACGPIALMQALAKASEALGWPASALHFESFGARSQHESHALKVYLSLSEVFVDVPRGVSVLDALIGADAFVSYDCKRGECGQCYTRVVEGAPIHHDICLTEEMRAQGMCTCVSWASEQLLVLEL
ncbi:PDR/VanB family oxidoreductase [Cupriavidus pauculus]|uniref:PDR/VanB family oxidoreductase n=1 Tax=Cupriavidus pauculus TaxID=82633 RepID=UPI001EE15883|nr:PDR/VanB family oxidoreductase [Cupriavidus pauculus]GJG94295.1 PDR/VanB family oxidoreductase [Cupriavidus pauculus]